jgi:Fe2+ transport system protein FeoA
MSANRLCCWKSGDEGVVTELAGDSALVHRLQDLGFVPGTPVKMIQHGCPMLIQVGNTRLSVRREDAKHIGAEAIPALDFESA